jgi:D-3-phosphoglycerate dehydrogenase
MTPKLFVSTAPFGAIDMTPREELQRTGWKIRYNDRNRKLTPQEVAELAADCDGLIAGTEDLMPLIEANPGLKLIARVGIGLDSVPLDLCRQRGIAVTYTPDAVTLAVVELTIGLMVGASRFVSQVDRAIRDGRWVRPQGYRIGESVVGLVGFGRIGSRVARALAGLAPRRILVADIVDKRREIDDIATATGIAIQQVPLEQLLAESGIVSLHVPLTRSTREMVGSDALQSAER